MIRHLLVTQTTMTHIPEYKVKIVGGKLLKIPVFNNYQENKLQMMPYTGHSVSGRNYSSNPSVYGMKNAGVGKSMDRLSINNALVPGSAHLGVSNNMDLNWTNEFQAQNNKAKALAQTYRSVLEPERNVIVDDAIHGKQIVSHIHHI